MGADRCPHCGVLAPTELTPAGSAPSSRAGQRSRKWFRWVIGGIGIVILAGVLSAAVSDRPFSEPSPPLDYLTQTVEPQFKLLQREVSDTPLKTQVLVKILVTGEVDKAGLTAVLERLTRRELATGGYKYRGFPSHVGIYAYTSDEHAASESGWIARLLRLGDNSPLRVDVNERLLRARSLPKTTRFGLSEEQRVRIWQDVARAQDRAAEEAEKAYPSPRLMDLRVEPGEWQRTATEYLKKQKALRDTLGKRYEDRVLTKYGLTRDQWGELQSEGIEKEWPLPPPH